MSVLCRDHQGSRNYLPLLQPGAAQGIGGFGRFVILGVQGIIAAPKAPSVRRGSSLGLIVGVGGVSWRTRGPAARRSLTYPAVGLPAPGSLLFLHLSVAVATMPEQRGTVCGGKWSSVESSLS